MDVAWLHDSDPRLGRRSDMSCVLVLSPDESVGWESLGDKMEREREERAKRRRCDGRCAQWCP